MRCKVVEEHPYLFPFRAKWVQKGYSDLSRSGIIWNQLERLICAV